MSIARLLVWIVSVISGLTAPVLSMEILRCEFASAPAIAYVVYVEYFSTASPPHQTVRRYTVGKLQTEVPKSAGDLLFYSIYDEGIAGMSLSPSGKYLLVAADNKHWIATPDSDLWLVSVDSKRQIRLTTDNAGYRDFRWTFDESLVGYSRQEAEGEYALYVQDTGTRKRKKLLAESFDSAWLPGHHLLVATSFRKDGLLVMQPDGGKLTTVRKGAKGGFVAVSQSGRRVVWVYHNRIRVVEWPADTNKVFQPAAWKSIGMFQPPVSPEESAFSPDGRLLAFLMPLDENAEQASQVIVVNPVSGLARNLGRLSGVVYQMRWSRKGEYLLLLHKDKISSPPELWAVPIGKAPLQPFRTLDWSQRSKAEYSVALRFPNNTEQVEWVESR